MLQPGACHSSAREWFCRPSLNLHVPAKIKICAPSPGVIDSHQGPAVVAGTGKEVAGEPPFCWACANSKLPPPKLDGADQPPAIRVVRPHFARAETSPTPFLVLVPPLIEVKASGASAA